MATLPLADTQNPCKAGPRPDRLVGCSGTHTSSASWVIAWQAFDGEDLLCLLVRSARALPGSADSGRGLTHRARPRDRPPVHEQWCGSSVAPLVGRLGRQVALGHASEPRGAWQGEKGSCPGARGTCQPGLRQLSSHGKVRCSPLGAVPARWSQNFRFTRSGWGRVRICIPGRFRGAAGGLGAAWETSGLGTGSCALSGSVSLFFSLSLFLFPTPSVLNNI